MNVAKAYDLWAESYDGDRNLTRDLDARVLRRVLKGVRVGSAVELGCGTGKNTVFLARAARRVLALDVSEGMLARARAKVRAAGVEFRRADLTRRWPCAAGSVQLVTADLVLEHTRRLGPVFAEARRVLTPGGAFFVCELHPFRQYLGKRAVFRRGGRAVTPPAFVHELSEFSAAGAAAGLRLERLDEWRHAEDGAGSPPRLVSLLFRKP